LKNVAEINTAGNIVMLMVLCSLFSRKAVSEGKIIRWKFFISKFNMETLYAVIMDFIFPYDLKIHPCHFRSLIRSELC
jgi:hypothetical protein